MRPTEIRIPLSQIETAAAERKPGYLAAALAAARREGDDLIFQMEDYHRLRREFLPDTERGRAISTADPYMEIISGCCDRADQY